MLTNLLKETLKILAENDKRPEDVLWVGVENHVGMWRDFEKLAANVNYDSGYGGNEIHSDLVVVGFDWWLERGEYDGAEWWEFKTRPSYDVFTKLSLTQENLMER